MSVSTERWTIVHDFAYAYGGAERVTSLIAKDLLPRSTVLMMGGEPSVYERMGVSGRVKQILPTPPFSATTYRQLGPLTPALLAVRPRVDGNVIASSYAFAHHVKATGRVVVYCHSPLRQIWSGLDIYVASESRARGRSLAMAAPMLRRWDRRAALRAQAYIATGSVVRDRLQRFYGIANAPVIPPPVGDEFVVERSVTRTRDYLWVGRLVEPYKNLTVVLEAFRMSPQRRLVVVGAGRDAAGLRRIAPRNVTFAGPLYGAALVRMYQTASAVIFSSADDFGMVPVESMACGTPVIAVRAGGALDTVRAGRGGIFFDEPTATALDSALSKFEARPWHPHKVAAEAEPYRSKVFLSKLSQAIAIRVGLNSA